MAVLVSRFTRVVCACVYCLSLDRELARSGP